MAPSNAIGFKQAELTIGSSFSQFYLQNLLNGRQYLIFADTHGRGFIGPREYRASFHPRLFRLAKGQVETGFMPRPWSEMIKDLDVDSEFYAALEN